MEANNVGVRLVMLVETCGVYRYSKGVVDRQITDTVGLTGTVVVDRLW